MPPRWLAFVSHWRSPNFPDLKQEALVLVATEGSAPTSPRERERREKEKRPKGEGFPWHLITHSRGRRRDRGEKRCARVHPLFHEKPPRMREGPPPSVYYASVCKFYNIRGARHTYRAWCAHTCVRIICMKTRVSFFRRYREEESFFLPDRFF